MLAAKGQQDDASFVRATYEFHSLEVCALWSVFAVLKLADIWILETYNENVFPLEALNLGKRLLQSFANLTLVAVSETCYPDVAMVRY
jgi:hypothetical protein